MRYGKTEIEEEESTKDFSFVPTPAAFKISSTPIAPHLPGGRPARRTLTPRDKEHNRKVDTFFDTVIPGLPIDRDAPQLRPPITPFSQVIEATLKRLDIQMSPFLDDLVEKWETLLPPAIAKLTRPGKWENNILYVYVPTSMKLFELRRTALHQIEEAVRAFAGDIPVRQVRLMVDVEPKNSKETS
jgi:hypothetical protein